MTSEIHDVIGIGFGPANIALAAALEERGSPLTRLFLEKSMGPAWQAAMLLGGSDIQNNPLRDLVTPRNPRSAYSFTNFLHVQGRLFEYLNLGLTYPLRKEYAQYVTWVAQHFDHCVRYGEAATDLRVVPTKTGFLYQVATADRTYLARSLVAAPGRTPLIPERFDGLDSDRIIHLTNYLPGLAHFQHPAPTPKRIAVIGGSQSAVEIVLDLSARFPQTEIVSIQRGYGFALKDTSPFSDRVYFPEHVDYYFNASRDSKRQLDAQLRRTNYGSADGDVLHQLSLTLYEQRLDGRERTQLLTNRAITAVTPSATHVTLALEELHRHEASEIDVDFVILATGFRNLGPGAAEETIPPVLRPLSDWLARDADGVLAVARDYRLSPNASRSDLPPIYLNGLCETTHGMGDAGSFSLLALRSELIATSLETALSVGREQPQATLLQAS